MAASETKMDVDSMSLERFCMAPRTLQEIIDEFSGMKAVMDELDAFQEHVRKMKDICYHSLHQTYYKAYDDLLKRMQNAHHMENMKRMEKLKLLMDQLLSKASELLNRHVDREVIQAYQQKFNEDFQQDRKHAQKIFMMKDGKTLVNPVHFIKGYHPTFKIRWAFFRYHKKGTNAPEGAAKNELQKIIKNYQGDFKVDIPHDSACVLEAYHADQKLQQRRDQLAEQYKERAKQILPRVLDYVGKGVLEVCNEYQTNTPESRFLFATRRVIQPIRKTTSVEQIPRGTIIGRQGQLKLKDQETNDRTDMDNSEQQIVINKTLRDGKTILTMHGIKIELNLSELVPYLTPTRPMPIYPDKKPYKRGHVFTDLLAPKPETHRSKRARIVASKLGP